MVKPRIPETNEGIQGAFDVKEYDLFARSMRDRGWMETGTIIKSGITYGNVLEIGSGPGYVGLEWLKNTSNTRLTGLEISKNMIDIALKNAKGYKLAPERLTYMMGNAVEMPFPSDEFDAVFSCGSLHEWEDPVKVITEIHRILKPNGRFCICDLRRDLSLPVQWLFKTTVKPKSMKPGLVSSLKASYVKREIETMIEQSPFYYSTVKTDLFGITVFGRKQSFGSDPQ